VVKATFDETIDEIYMTNTGFSLQVHWFMHYM